MNEKVTCLVIFTSLQFIGITKTEFPFLFGKISKLSFFIFLPAFFPFYIQIKRVK